jgi:hypothetical protein
MARSRRSGMSVVWSLSRVNRTWPERPDSVAFDPLTDIALDIVHYAEPTRYVGGNFGDRHMLPQMFLRTPS